MPASEYYAIYKKHSLNRSSSFSETETTAEEVKDKVYYSEELDDDDDDMETKVPTAEVKVHGGGIAER